MEVNNIEAVKSITFTKSESFTLLGSLKYIRARGALNPSERTILKKLEELEEKGAL